MKKVFVFTAFLFIVANSFSQWVNILPDVYITSGKVGIGNNAPGVLCDIGSATKSTFAPTNSGITGLQVRQTFSNTTGSLSSFFYQAQTAATTSGTIGAMGYVNTANPTGTAAFANGLHGLTEHSAAGTVTWSRGVMASGLSTTATGTITNWAGFYSGGVGATSTGTITNAYGLFIGANGTGVTNKYGVWVDDANATNYFGGSIVLGGTVSATNFIGTTTSAPLNLKVNNAFAGTIDPTSFNELYGQAIANSGSNNVGMGYTALNVNTGSSNTGIGYAALKSNGSGTNNTGLGREADVSTSGLTDATALGYGAKVNASHKVRIGGSTVTVVEGPVAYTISDGRFKNNISESDVKGLEFINRLRPVVYNFDTRKFEEFLTNNMPGDIRKKHLENTDFKPSTAIRQSGFIAQEVEKAAKEVGYDFNGLHAPETKDDNYSLAYAAFVVPLVKSVQQLSKQNDEMKKEIEELKTLIKGKTEGSIKISQSNDAQLFQNAPNPFNKSTVIKYSIPFTAKKAVINITSISGTKIKEYDLNNKAQAIEINGGQLSAGTYIYSLIVDDVFIDSKQMILTK